MRKAMMVLMTAVTGAAAACASASTSMWAVPVLRPAESTPPRFLTEDGTTPTDGCRNPLIDPRDDTRLRLLRSGAVGGEQRGDYEVSLGRYGVGGGELLRIDCGTGQPLGVVARS